MAASEPDNPRPVPPVQVAAPKPAALPGALCVDMHKVDIMDMNISFGQSLRRPAPDANARAGIADAVGADPSAVIDVLRLQGDEHVAVVGRCQPKSCAAWLVRAAPDGARWRVAARTSLWFTKRGYEPGGPGLSADAFGLADIDEDGRDELWLEYVSTGRPTAIAAPHYGHVAAFEVPTLAPLMNALLTTSPMIDDAPACDAMVSRVDLDCDQHEDVVITRECGISRCLGEASLEDTCAAHPLRHQRIGYRWRPKHGRYVSTPVVDFQRPPFEMP